MKKRRHLPLLSPMSHRGLQILKKKELWVHKLSYSKTHFYIQAVTGKMYIRTCVLRQAHICAVVGLTENTAPRHHITENYGSAIRRLIRITAASWKQVCVMNTLAHPTLYKNMVYRGIHFIFGGSKTSTTSTCYAHHVETLVASLRNPCLEQKWEKNKNIRDCPLKNDIIRAMKYSIIRHSYICLKRRRQDLHEKKKKGLCTKLKQYCASIEWMSWRCLDAG